MRTTNAEMSAGHGAADKGETGTGRAATVVPPDAGDTAWVGSELVAFKLTGRATADACMLTVNATLPHGGPPLHRTAARTSFSTYWRASSWSSRTARRRGQRRGPRCPCRAGRRIRIPTRGRRRGSCWYSACPLASSASGRRWASRGATWRRRPRRPHPRNWSISRQRRSTTASRSSVRRWDSPAPEERAPSDRRRCGRDVRVNNAGFGLYNMFRRRAMISGQTRRPACQLVQRLMDGAMPGG